MQHPADDVPNSPARTGSSAHDARPGADPLAPGAVRRERELPVVRDEAWALLRDAAGLTRWLADRVDLEVIPGAEGTITDGHGERRVVVEEVDEGRHVALRWWAPGEEAALVDLRLEPITDASTRLVVTEVPLRVVAVPAAAPASWTGAGSSGPGAGPQLALACR